MIPAPLAASLVRRFGSHANAGTDHGCCAWDNRCWCGYGVALDILEGTSRYEDVTRDRNLSNVSGEQRDRIRSMWALLDSLRAALENDESRP